MKNRVKLSDIMGCCHCSVVTFYFNIRSYKIEQICDILEKCKLQKEYFENYYYEFDYIPLPISNEAEIIREFIAQQNNRKYIKYFSGISDENLWMEFDNIFHYGDERDHWDIYYHNRIKKIAEAWCRDNHILFDDDTEW